jgi:hypothetical protein
LFSRSCAGARTGDIVTDQIVSGTILIARMGIPTRSGSSFGLARACRTSPPADAGMLPHFIAKPLTCINPPRVPRRQAARAVVGTAPLRAGGTWIGFFANRCLCLSYRKTARSRCHEHSTR